MAEEKVIVNALVLQALVAIEEVMGKNGLNAVLKSSGLSHLIDNPPPDNMDPGVKTEEYARLNQAIEDFYGRGAKGFLYRIGKASFHYGLEKQSALMGIAGAAALKVLPQKQRITTILNSVASALKKSNPQVNAYVEDQDGKIAYVDATCGICEGRTSTEPVCHLYVGSLSEAVKWATGKDYGVVETDCTAKGDPFCRFEIQEPAE
jgi:predicted hydrocarbon binding protein